jgi:hypothetical protein
VTSATTVGLVYPPNSSARPIGLLWHKWMHHYISYQLIHSYLLEASPSTRNM